MQVHTTRLALAKTLGPHRLLLAFAGSAELRRKG